jgi:hypothetical protein
VQEYYDTVIIVYLHNLGVTGTIDKMGAYASIVRYKKDEVEYEELIENNEFAILDELVFEHIIEEQ